MRANFKRVGEGIRHAEQFALQAAVVENQAFSLFMLDNT
jgi:hypothetical protein